MRVPRHRGRILFIQKKRNSIRVLENAVGFSSVQTYFYRLNFAYRERVLFNSVTSTLQWIRQPEPRDVHDVSVFVCNCVLGSPRASQPLN